MAQKIILVQHGPAYEVLLLSSILIGFKKKHPQARILWVGEPKYFHLIKFNKRVKKCLDIKRADELINLPSFYNSDICYNPSQSHQARQFSTLSNSQQYYGFTKDGPVNRNAEFFQKVLVGQLETRKTILDLYYDLGDMKWKGEGYGLNYYPRLRQTKGTGIHCRSDIDAEGEIISQTSTDLLSKFDTLNQFSYIITDDLFILHAGLALRKRVSFVGQLPYTLNFQSSTCLVPPA